MIRRVAIAVGVVVLLVAIGWKLVPPRAELACCKFTSKPTVTFNGQRLGFKFDGREPGDLLHELKGGDDHDARILWAILALHDPLEPGTFAIDGEVRSSGNGWTFRPSAKNDPKILTATILVTAIDTESAFDMLTAQVHGTLIINRVSEAEFAGHLELSTTDSGSTGAGRDWGPARVSSPFSAKLGPNGETVD